MISEETEKELKELLKEVDKIIEQIRGFVFSNEKLTNELWMQTVTHNLKITDKIEKITKKIEKEQGYDKKRKTRTRRSN